MKKSDFNFANAFKTSKKGDEETSKILQSDEIHASANRRMTASVLDCIFYIALNWALFRLFSIDLIKDINHIFGKINYTHIVLFCWIALPIILELLPKRQTLGKMILGIYVETKSISFFALRVISRNLIKLQFIFPVMYIFNGYYMNVWHFLFFDGILAFAFLYLNIYMMFDSIYSISLHDKICGTIVLKRKHNFEHY